MSDFSEAYGMLFIGIVVVMLFLSCYKILEQKSQNVLMGLKSDYLASKFKKGFYESSNLGNNSATFAFPMLDFNRQKIIEAVIYE